MNKVRKWYHKHDPNCPWWCPFKFGRKVKSLFRHKPKCIICEQPAIDGTYCAFCAEQIRRREEYLFKIMKRAEKLPRLYSRIEHPKFFKPKTAYEKRLWKDNKRMPKNIRDEDEE